MRDLILRWNDNAKPECKGIEFYRSADAEQAYFKLAVLVEGLRRGELQYVSIEREQDEQESTS